MRKKDVYKLRYLPSFDTDLAEAENYLYEFSPPAADRLSQALNEQVANLIKYPFMFPIYSNYFGDKKYRMMPLPYQFLCFYIVNENTKTINMYRVLHSAKDISKIL